MRERRTLTIFRYVACASLAVLAGVTGLGLYSVFQAGPGPGTTLSRATLERATSETEAARRVARAGHRVRRLGDEETRPASDPEPARAGPHQSPPQQRTLVKKARHAAGAETAATWPNAAGQTFRTVCVRLCDGAFFPISEASTGDSLAADAERCTRRCASPARLFIRSDDASIANMMDVSGKRYEALANAFRFRSERNPTCTCGPEAWQDAARDRHQTFRLEQSAEARHGQGTDLAIARALALRHAVEDLRSAGPVDERIALASGDAAPAASRAPLLFGPAVVAPLEPSDARAPAPLRFTGDLKPATVVLDATGSPVMRRHAAKPPEPVRLVAVVRDAAMEPSNQIATGSLQSRPDEIVHSVAARPEAVPAAETHGESLSAGSVGTKARAEEVAVISRKPNDRAAHAAQQRPSTARRGSAGQAQRVTIAAAVAATVTPPNSAAQDLARSQGEQPAARRKPQTAAQSAVSGKAAKAGKTGASPRLATDRHAKPSKPAANGTKFTDTVLVAAGPPARGPRRVARAEIETDWKELLFRPY